MQPSSMKPHSQLALIYCIEYQQKPLDLQCCDFILRPVHVLFGMKTIIQKGRNWTKQEMAITNFFWVAVSFLSFCVLTPIILPCAYYKIHSQQHQCVYHNYQFLKKQQVLKNYGFRVIHKTHQDTSFMLRIEKENTVQNFIFSLYGKLRWKSLFSKSLPA